MGFAVGVTATAILFWSQKYKSKEVFEQNVQCGEIAEEHERENFGVQGLSGIVEVIHSAKRNSCVARIARITTITGVRNYDIVDLLSRRVVWSKFVTLAEVLSQP